MFFTESLYNLFTATPVIVTLPFSFEVLSAKR